MDHAIVSHEEWLGARKALLAKERALTHELEALHAERRELPWVRVDKPYVFHGPDGDRTLAELFGARSQLAIYHFMLTPGSDHICPGCSFVSDHVDAARQHFEQADLSFAAVSRVPLARIEEVKHRMGWTFPWVSSDGGDFNFDFGVSFTADESASGEVTYNFRRGKAYGDEMPGISVFFKDAAGAIYRTYSCYSRGLDMLNGAYHYLDLVPKGRDEDALPFSMGWLRLHDEYGA